MATITIDIPNDKLTLVANALAWTGGYQATITDAQGNQVANPITKNQFAKLQVIKYIKNSVKEYEDMTALQAAKTEVTLT